MCFFNHSLHPSDAIKGHSDRCFVRVAVRVISARTTVSMLFFLHHNARSEYHTQLAKMSFGKIFDLTDGVFFNFYNILRNSRR